MTHAIEKALIEATLQPEGRASATGVGSVKGETGAVSKIQDRQIPALGQIGTRQRAARARLKSGKKKRRCANAEDAQRRTLMPLDHRAVAHAENLLIAHGDEPRRDNHPAVRIERQARAQEQLRPDEPGREHQRIARQLLSRLQATGSGRPCANATSPSDQASAIQTGQAAGMQTLDQCLKELLQKGLITKEEARFRAQNKEDF